VKRTSVAIAIAFCVMLIGADVASGAGFEVAELSVRQLGNAYAGKAASGSDAAIAYFNPAGMTLFEGNSLSLPIHLLQTRGSWNDNGSTGIGQPLGDGSLGGGDGGDPGGMVVIPNLYFIWSATEDLKVGLSINSPFGMATEYDDGWQGRYVASLTELVTINVNPSVAYRLDEVFSIGAGISWQHAEAELTNEIDFGTIGWAALGPGAGKLGMIPQGTDGRGGVEGESDAIGWNIGLLIEFSKSTRIGLAYRSSILQNLDGDAKFKVPSEASVLKQSGAFKNTGGNVRLKLPDQFYISLYTEITDEWTFLADITWTGWSVFEEIKITYDNPNQPTTVIEENWNDVMRYSIGFNYKPMEDLVLRIGGAFDESPIPDESRSPRIPTNDRWWFALGASYQINEMFSVDLSWMHVFIRDGRIDQTTATGQRLKGSFEGDADVLGLQVNVSF